MRIPSSNPRKLVWKVVRCLIAILTLVSAGSLYSKSVYANPLVSLSSSPYDVITAVNQLRQTNGLPPLEINSALMVSAQVQSDYQASIGKVTHTGTGGSNAKNRAIAAGYGSGATVFISENIYGGANASPQQAVQWWQGDDLHLSTMLGASYTDVGAGVATNGNVVYYTLDVGYVDGSPGVGGGVQATLPAPNATPIALLPIQIATPMPDGSIVHTVQAGQTMWSIAAAYGVDLNELLRLNNRDNDTTIYPGDQLLISPPESTPTPTITATESAQKTRVPGKTTQNTSSPRATLQTETPPSISPEPQEATKAPNTNLLMILIIAFLGGGAALLLVGGWLSRRK